MTDQLTPRSITDFVAHLGQMHKTEPTIKAYQGYLRRFLAHCDDELFYDEIPAESLDWFDDLTPSSVGPALAAVRSYSQWADLGDLHRGYSLPSVRQKRRIPLPRGMDDVHTMADLAEDDDTRLIILLCGTMGMRISEALLKVHAEHVDLDNNEIEILGKGAKWRSVPIPDRIKDDVAKALIRNNGGYLTGGKGYTATHNKIKDLAQLVGITQCIGTHDLRSTFATYVWDRTGDQLQLMKLMGHSSFDTTARYIAIEASELQSAVN